MTRDATERTIDAEVRCVEEGHRAFLDNEGKQFLVVSDTLRDTRYRVGVVAVGDEVTFTCDHVTYRGHAQPARTTVPCKHGALAARRLEREGLLVWDGKAWRPTAKAFAHRTPQPDDPFDGLPGC